MFNWFRRSKPTIPNDAIIATFDPWTLACAAASENGSLGARIPYRSWCSISRKNWMPDVKQLSGASEKEIMAALDGYVAQNRHRPYTDILRTEEQKRGLPASTVLGPGESMAVTVNFQYDDQPEEMSVWLK